jgi:Zn-dependent protease with chaperone function
MARYVYRNQGTYRLFTPLQVTRPTLLSSLPYKISLRLRSSRLRTFTLDLYSPSGVPFDSLTLNAILADVLVFPGSPVDVPPVIGNTLSLIGHSRGCNHLPDASHRQAFASRAEAENAGYSLCSICFRHTPPIYDFALEQTIGRHQLSSVLSAASISDVDSLNARVETVGRRVLARWPVPLRGYTYTFRVLDDPSLNAYACATGRVFVNAALLTACESDHELEAILAHEITHVERRHAYQQFSQAIDNQAAGALAALLVGIAVAVGGRDANNASIAMQITSIIATVASEIAQIGHTRANEAEADAYSIAYLSAAGYADATAALVAVLSKLQYAETFGGMAGVGPTALMTHPYIDDRIDRAGKMHVEILPAELRYVGMEKDSVPLVVVTLTAKTSVEYKEAPSVGSLLPPTVVHEVRVLGTMEGLDELDRPIPLKFMTVSVGGRQFMLDNYEDTRIYPGAVIGFNAFAKQPASFGLIDFSSVSFAVPGVSVWKRLSEE